MANSGTIEYGYSMASVKKNARRVPKTPLERMREYSARLKGKMPPAPHRHRRALADYREYKERLKKKLLLANNGSSNIPKQDDDDDSAINKADNNVENVLQFGDSRNSMNCQKGRVGGVAQYRHCSQAITSVQNPNALHPKTAVESTQEYRSKCQTANDVSSVIHPKYPKTPAERMRKYRELKKSKLQTVIDTILKYQKTEAQLTQEYRSNSQTANDVFSIILPKDRKIAAERMRNYRARKRCKFEAAIDTFLRHRKIKADRTGEYRNKCQTANDVSSVTHPKHQKTAAERRQEYRVRKRSNIQAIFNAASSIEPNFTEVTSEEQLDDIAEITIGESGVNSNLILLNNAASEIKENSNVTVKNNYKFKKCLISRVRKHQQLYNPLDKNFSNIAAKNIIWTKIADKLKVEAELCKNTWVELRLDYQRYVRRLRKFFQSGNKNNKLRPVMPFETDMIFLWRFIANRKCFPLPRNDSDNHESSMLSSKKQTRAEEDDVILYEEPIETINLDEDDAKVTRTASTNENTYKVTKDIRKLVGTIKPYKELYDSQHRYFSDYKRRGIIWCSIANEVGDKATKLMKFWYFLQTRYEAELNAEHQTAAKNSKQRLQPSPELAELLDFLKPYTVANPKTVYKQSYYLNKYWGDPIDNFKHIYHLLCTLKECPAIIDLTESMLTVKDKSVEYFTLWKTISDQKGFTPCQCEVTWLLLRNFYWELMNMRKAGYKLQDKWYFESFITDLYAHVAAVLPVKMAAPMPSITGPQIKKAKPKTTQQPRSSAAARKSLAHTEKAPATAKPAAKSAASTATIPTIEIEDDEPPIKMPKIVDTRSLATVEDIIKYHKNNKNAKSQNPNPPTASPTMGTGKLPTTTKMPVKYFSAIPSSASSNMVPDAASVPSISTSISQKLPDSTLINVPAPVPIPVNGNGPVQVRSYNNKKKKKVANPTPLFTEPFNCVGPSTPSIHSTTVPPLPTQMPQLPSVALPPLSSFPTPTSEPEPIRTTVSVPMSAILPPPLKISKGFSLPTTTVDVSVPKVAGDVSLPIPYAVSLLNANEIMIELKAFPQGNQLVVHGPPLSENYAISMKETAKFIREIMSIPQLHSKYFVDTKLYWQYLSDQFHLPTHICRACWNFLAENFNHFPKIAPMEELMTPVKPLITVWSQSDKLFTSFLAHLGIMGWVKYRTKLPALLVKIGEHPELHKISQLTQNERVVEEGDLSKLKSIWCNIFLAFGGSEIKDIWTYLARTFWQYMDELEQCIHNSWPLGWWEVLSKLEFLVPQRYGTHEPFYFITKNKIKEEIKRCIELEKQNKSADDPPSVTSTKTLEPEGAKLNPTLPVVDRTPAISTKTTTNGEVSCVLKQYEVLNCRSTIIADCFNGLNVVKWPLELDAFNLIRVIRKHPQVYQQCSKEQQRVAWEQVAQQLNTNTTTCIQTFKRALLNYRAYKACDTAYPSRYHIAKKYFNLLDEIYPNIKPLNSGKLNIKTPSEINMSVDNARGPCSTDFAYNYIPEINMDDCKPRLVMKNWSYAVASLPVDAQAQVTETLNMVFKKYSQLATPSS